MICVYRYIDLSDNIIKYIGIVKGDNSNLANRVDQHKCDYWVYDTKWRIEFIEENVNTRTDAEMLEAHFISLFETNQWFNVAKSNWGVSSFIPKIEEWQVYQEEVDYNSRSTYVEILKKKIENLESQDRDIINRNKKLELINKKLRDTLTYLLPFGLKRKFYENINLDDIKDEETFDSIIEEYISSINKQKEIETGQILHIKMLKDKTFIYIFKNKPWIKRARGFYSNMQEANIIEDNDDNLVVEIPSSWIRLPKAPRTVNYTDEQRAALAERMSMVRQKIKEGDT